MNNQERWGFVLHVMGTAVGWIPPNGTKLLVYNSDNESLPIAYKDGNLTVRIAEPEGEGIPNPQFEKYCYNKYKIDLIARAYLKSIQEICSGESMGLSSKPESSLWICP